MSQDDDDDGGPTGEEGNVREVVETCLATEDLTPLLRLILDSDASVLAHRPSYANISEAPVVDPHQQFEERWAMVEIIQNCLEGVAADQDRIILDVCHANATEISQCVSELSDMHLLVGDLKRLLSANNSKLQAAGSALLTSAHNLSELVTVQGNVTSGIAAVVGMRELLQQCLDIGALLDQGQLYPALLLLERVRSTKLEPLLTELAQDGSPPPHQQPRPPRLSHGGSPIVSVSTAPKSKASSGGLNPSVTSLALKAFFQNLLSELTAAAKQLAVSEFNSWLVLARSHAQRLGLRAIRRAATHRQLEEDLSRERRTLLSMLESGRDIREAASQFAVSGVRTQLAQDLAPAVSPGVMQAMGGMQAPGPGPAGRGLGTGVGDAEPAAGRAGSQVLERVATRSRHRKGGSGLPTDSDPPNSATSTSASVLRSDVQGPGISQEPDLAMLHVGKPHLALKELLAWQRQQATAIATMAAGPGGASANATATGKAGAAGNEPGVNAAQQHRSRLALGVSASAMEGDAVAGLLHGFDLTGLLRCLHVHKVLGHLHKFREYYLEQRRLQVTNDLAPPQQFLESYQPYLAQVTGFFVVESCVERLFPELISKEQVMFLWEGAISSLRTSLDTALELLNSSTIMVLLKDFVMLMCLALGHCGYPTAAVQDVLLTNRPRYHDLLMAAVSKEAAQAMERDALSEGCQVLNEAQLRDYRQLGLPLVLEGTDGGDLKPPLYAPFSKCVPALLQQIRGFVRDSVSYLEGLFSPWELPQAIFHHRNRLITKVVVDVLQARVASASSQGSLPSCLRMVANIWALLKCLDALDAWTVEQARPHQQQQESRIGGTSGQASNAEDGLAVRGGGTGGTRSRKAAAAQDSVTSNAQVALRAIQDVAEKAVLRLVSQRVSKAMDKLRAMPWLPPGPAGPGRSPYVEEIVQILQEVFYEAKARLPRSSYLYLCRTITRSIGAAIIRLFSADGTVKAYNLCAIQRLASDVAELQMAAAECGVPDVALEFAASAQLCSLLLSDKVEEVLVPELRKQRYPQLETSTIVIALDRYKELSKIGKEKTNFPAKKITDNVAKQLRGQMVQGTSSRAIGDF